MGQLCWLDTPASSTITPLTYFNQYANLHMFAIKTLSKTLMYECADPKKTQWNSESMEVCHFFTLTHFESWKFYTRKVHKFTTYLPITVIFSFFWNLFTLSQKFYTHGVPDKYQVCSPPHLGMPLLPRK